jgi:8-oxo-dGTP diphosphatase
VGKILKSTIPVAGDDAKNAQWFKINDLPPLAFDHSRILEDVLKNQ